MGDNLAPAHERLASSRYATIIVALTSFLFVAGVALDEKRSAAVDRAAEFKEKTHHAECMMARVNALAQKTEWPLLELCYDATLAHWSCIALYNETWDHQIKFGVPLRSSEIGEKPRSQFEYEAETAYAILSDGPYSDAVFSEVVESGRPSVRWAQSRSKNLAGVLSPIIKAQPPPADIDTKIADAISSQRDPSASYESVPLDNCVRAAKDLFGPTLTTASVQWVVTGRFFHQGWKPDLFPTGFRPTAINGVLTEQASLATLNSAWLEDRPLGEARVLLERYLAALETTPRALAENDATAPVFGTGVSLRLTHLISLAAILLGATQCIYLVALAHDLRAEKNKSSQTASEAAYPAFPRFSSPPDPFERGWPKTFELGFERVIYAAFLAVPSILSLLLFISGQHLSRINLADLDLRSFSHIPWSPTCSYMSVFGRDPYGDSSTWRDTLHLWSVALGLFAVHRTVLAQRAPKRNVPQRVLIGLGLLATGLTCCVIRYQGHTEVLTGLLVMFPALLLLVWPWRKKWWTRLCVVVAVLIMYYIICLSDPYEKQVWSIGTLINIPIINVRLPDYLRVLARVFVPTSVNALVPVFIVATGMVTAWIQNVRFSKWFFTALATFLAILILF